jgi:FkbM family methyltransferase
MWDDATRMTVQGEFLRLHGFRQKKPARYLNNALESVFFELLSLINPSAIIEIGAHAAEFSRKARSKFENVAQLIAVEANPDVYDAHKHRIEEAGIIYVNCAISKENGTVTLRIPEIRGIELPTMGSIRDSYVDADSITSKTYVVASRTLDSFDLQDSVIWLDVEGGISEVISGGRQTFSSALAVYAELDDQPQWQGGMTASDTITELAKFGLVPILRDCEHPFAYNCIFVRRDMLLGGSGKSGAAAISNLQNRYWRKVRLLSSFMPWWDLRLVVSHAYRHLTNRSRIK